MGVSVLFDLVNFSGNTCCFHLVSKFHDLYFLHPSFYQNSLLMKRQNGNISYGLGRGRLVPSSQKGMNFDMQLSDSAAAEMRESES